MWLAIAALISVFTAAEGSHFRGSYLTWVVNDTDSDYYPANHNSSVAKIQFRYGASWRRSDGASLCTNSSIETCQLFKHGSWLLFYGYHEHSQPYNYATLSAGFYCEKFNTEYDFTVGSNTLTVYLPKHFSYRLRTASCCWIYGLKSFSSSSWNVEAVVSFKKRSAYYSMNANKINTPPQIEHIPVIQHYRYSNEQYMLPVSDPDGDKVECRWAANSTEGGGVYRSRINYATLYKNCILHIYSNNNPGWYAFAIMIEDFAYNYQNGKHERQSSVPLQFTVYIYNSNATIIYGNNKTDCKGSHIQIFGSKSSNASPLALPSSSAMMSANPLTTPSMRALDGCKHYQVLSHQDRSMTFYDWSHYRCDKELFGWYRFMGLAGNRMSHSCPSGLAGSYYRCGSYYQGWIFNGASPSVKDGAVARLVCFSPYYSCSCSYSKSVLIKNCGSFYVYWLDSVPTCNSRYCGIKIADSVVSCSQNYMRIDLDRSFYDTFHYKSITLRSPSCSATYTSSKIILGSALGSCGSVRSETSSHIVYENEVIMKANATNGVISREVDQRIKFTCFFDKHTKSSFVPSLGYLPISNVTGEEVGYGNFSFNFVMYTDRSYSRMHSYYPVSVQLRDWMYFEVYASTSDSNVIVLIDQCFSTPTMDRNHYLKYTFINNRCPSDKTVAFHKTSHNRQRFSIQAFKFLSNSTAVYFHCLVFLCHASSNDYRCRYGCQGNNIYRGKRAISPLNEPSGYYLLDREVRLKQVSNDKPPETGSQISSSSYAAIGLAAVFACVVIGLATKIVRMKKKASVSPAPEKEKRDQGNRYANDGEVLPPHYQADHEQELTEDDMHNIGIISKDKQAEILSDRVFHS